MYKIDVKVIQKWCKNDVKMIQNRSSIYAKLIQNWPRGESNPHPRGSRSLGWTTWLYQSFLFIIIITHHQSSFIITHHHSSSFIIIHHQSSSSIITHHHSSSFIIIHHHSPTRRWLPPWRSQGTNGARILVPGLYIY